MSLADEIVEAEVLGEETNHEGGAKEEVSTEEREIKDKETKGEEE